MKSEIKLIFNRSDLNKVRLGGLEKYLSENKTIAITTPCFVVATNSSEEIFTVHAQSEVKESHTGIMLASALTLLGIEYSDGLFKIGLAIPTYQFSNDPNVVLSDMTFPTDALARAEDEHRQISKARGYREDCFRSRRDRPTRHHHEEDIRGVRFGTRGSTRASESSWEDCNSLVNFTTELLIVGGAPSIPTLVPRAVQSNPVVKKDEPLTTSRERDEPVTKTTLERLSLPIPKPARRTYTQQHDLIANFLNNPNNALFFHPDADKSFGVFVTNNTYLGNLKGVWGGDAVTGQQFEIDNDVIDGYYCLHYASKLIAVVVLRESGDKHTLITRVANDVLTDTDVSDLPRSFLTRFLVHLNIPSEYVAKITQHKNAE